MEDPFKLHSSSIVSISRCLFYPQPAPCPGQPTLDVHPRVVVQDLHLHDPLAGKTGLQASSAEVEVVIILLVLGLVLVHLRGVELSTGEKPNCDSHFGLHAEKHSF